MMNRLTSTISVITVSSALLISGCGGETDFILGTNTLANADRTFDGTWTQSCEYDQVLGEGEFSSLTLDGSMATLNTRHYLNSTCSGVADSHSTIVFEIEHVGQIALSDCINAQKVNTKLQYPITLKNVAFTEAQFNVLPAIVIENIKPIATSDLLCMNRTGTVLYTGDKTSGAGSSVVTRPTRADLTSGMSLR